MVLTLRLAGVIISSFFKRRIDYLGTSVVTMRVWPNDLDFNVHMNSGRYVSIADLGRIDLLCRMKLLRRVIQKGWRPIAGGTMIRYRRSLLPFQKFSVHSRLLCWDDKWFYFEHRIERDGELCALAHVRGLMRDGNRNVTPTEFATLAGAPSTVSPAMPEFIRLWNEAEELR